MITLETEESTSGCPSVTTTDTVYVTRPVAEFTIPKEMCDNLPYMLNATDSKDVFASCHKGFLWEFEMQRPRETEREELSHVFLPGRQEVTLTVEDINGCTATTSRTTNVYGIEPLTNLDSVTCLPYPKQLEDLSSSDTTLVSWEWDFGNDSSTEQNPFYEFTTVDLDTTISDSTLMISFVTEDAIGCRDSITQNVTIRETHFFIKSDMGNRACAGDSVLFTVIDTAGIKDIYDFTWTFEDGTQMVGDTVLVNFSDDGRQIVELSYNHRNGHCEGLDDLIMIIFPTPDAQFSASTDSLQFICYPHQIQFLSDEDLHGNNFDFSWNFGDNQVSDLRDPIIGFGRGEHEVTLVVSNPIGCIDSLTQSYTLVGPAADFEADHDIICTEDEITFTVSNLENVSHYTIDLGDGSPLIENQSSITHSYSELPTVISLIAESSEFGCEVVDTLAVQISQVSAFFEFVCGGTVVENLSVDANQFEWDFGGVLSSNEENPEYPYQQLQGETLVSLTVSDGICSSHYETLISSEPSFEMANLFSPNGDGHNDRFLPANAMGATDEVRIRTFQIYNRWGKLVYDNEDPEGWAGFYNGEEAPPEVYAYFIEMDIPGCGMTAQKGNVTLIR